MKNYALIIGNSSGIGLAVTSSLLQRGWQVSGISRSESPLKTGAYQHDVAQVQQPKFVQILKSAISRQIPDLLIYCAGIGEKLDFSNMEPEIDTISVNLLGMVRTASVVIPLMVQQGTGHFIGLSSVADEMLSPEAPGYHASKAGVSNYLESLALAVMPHGVHVTNIRFGFVATKMAKGEKKPFMMSVGRAVRHVLYCIEKKPVRHTAPRVVIPLVKFRNRMLRLGTR